MLFQLLRKSEGAPSFPFRALVGASMMTRVRIHHTLLRSPPTTRSCMFYFSEDAPLFAKNENIPSPPSLGKLPWGSNVDIYWSASKRKEMSAEIGVRVNVWCPGVCGALTKTHGFQVSDIPGDLSPFSGASALILTLVAVSHPLLIFQ